MRAPGGVGTRKPDSSRQGWLEPRQSPRCDTCGAPRTCLHWARGEPQAPSTSTVLAEGLAARDPAPGTCRLPWHGHPQARECWAARMPHWWAEDAPAATLKQQCGPSSAPLLPLWDGKQG